MSENSEVYLETKSFDYKTVVVEGGDQVGKGDAAIQMCEKLSEYLPVTKISFPTYSLPIGSCIRKMLKGEMDDICKNSSPQEEFEARMAMFALNRLEVLNSLLDDKYEGRLLILDRSPFSNALTIAYGLSQDKIEENDIFKYAEKGLDQDEFIIKALGLGSCVIELYDENQQDWNGVRSKGDDQYENNLVQKVCGKVYNAFSKSTESGWKKIATKNGDSWRDRKDILMEVLSFVSERYPDLLNSRIDDKDVDILELTEACRTLYLGCDVSSESNQRLAKALVGNNKADMYSSSLDIAQEIVDTTKEIRWRNEGIKEAFKKIIHDNHLCLKMMEHAYGEKYVKLLINSFE